MSFKSKYREFEVTPDHQLFIKPNFAKLVRHQAFKRPTQRFVQSPLNPNQSIQEDVLIEKSMDKKAKQENVELMDSMRVHIVKAAITAATDKLVYGNDPTMVGFAKGVAVFHISERFVKKQVTTMRENVLGKALMGLDDKTEEAIDALVSNLLTISAVNMRLPMIEDLVLMAVPEVVDTFVAGGDVDSFLDKNFKF